MSYCSIQAGSGRPEAVHMISQLTAITSAFRGFTNAPLDAGIFQVVRHHVAAGSNGVFMLYSWVLIRARLYSTRHGCI